MIHWSLHRGLNRLLFGSIRRTLVALLIIVLVPILVVDAVHHYFIFQDRRAQELQANLELARAVASNFDSYIQNMLHEELILGLALSPPLPVEQANQLMEASGAGDPSIRSYRWVDPRGLVVASNDPAIIGLDISDRPYFREIADGREWSVSDLLVGRVSGKVTFFVARGIRDGDGTLQGVVAAAVQPERLGGVLAVERAAKGAIVIIDGNGWGVYRYPEIAMTWEQRDWIAATPIIAQALSGEEVTGTVVGIGNEKRMAGWTPIPAIGWVASASRTEEEVVAPLVQDLLRQLGFDVVVAAVALLIALGAGRSITLPLRRLREQALAVGRGDLGRWVSPFGPRELGELGDAFNQMSDEIQAREEVLQRYQSLSHYARDIILFVSLDGCIIEANDAALEAYGYSREELLSMKIDVLRAPETSHLLAAQLAEAEARGILFETVHRRKDGTTFPVEVSARGTTVGNGRVLLSIIRDIGERKRAEEELRLRAHLLDAATDSVFLHDLDMNIIYVNEAACKSRGYSRDELLAMRFRNVIAPEHAGLIESRKKELLEKGEFTFESTHVRKDHSIMPVEVHARVIELGGKKLVLNSCRDITERQQAEEALHKSEEKYHSLVENIPDVVWRADKDGNAVFMSPNMERLDGYTSQEICAAGGHSWLERIHPEDVAGVREAYDLLFAGSSVYDVEYRLQRKDGSWIWVRDRAKAIIKQDGVFYADGVLSDISERKRLLDQLKETNEQLVRASTQAEEQAQNALRHAAELSAIFTSIADGLIIYGPDGQITYLNPAAEEVLGYTLEERLLPAEERLRLIRAETAEGNPLQVDQLPAWRALEGETVHGFVIVVRRSPDRVIWTFASAAPILAPDGRIMGAVSVFTDVTEMRRLQEQVEGYVSLISHDLRNPLTVVQGHAQALQRALENAGLTGREKRSADDIVTASRRMNTMIQDLLDSVRIESGQLDLQSQPVSLVSFVHDLLERSGFVMDVGRIKVDIPSEIPPVRADQDRLERVFANLLTNALKYSGQETEVQVRVETAGGGVVVSVADRGVGIAPEDLPHIFERFYRTRGGRKPGGVGLGLHICKMLVEAHGGSIWVESVLGESTTFYFTLPLA